jgi:glycosyltransferase involved in cell wall biosynthesis
VESILPSLTIFFPCYNDERTIEQLVEDAISVGYGLTDDLEVIVIDDGSIDGSRRLLETLRMRHSELQLVCHDLNRGYGAALRSGFSAATREWVFYTDGDGQYDVGDLPELATEAVNADVVNGHKISRSDRWHRIWIGIAHVALVRVFLICRFGILTVISGYCEQALWIDLICNPTADRFALN